MHWAVEIDQTNLRPRNLADLLAKLPIDGGTGYNKIPDSAVSNNGTAVVVWKKGLNGGNHIYGNFFQ